ncbi:glycosyltransferase family 2 protein [Amaricoccus solimangrovi]|uniref:Glycosyltransferase family 2 protein n=1 Tax=Amaricoccus solimangrovi TaxID=2589815 RepID=A0A501WJ45_9RHOB|nr:glycosyltransferase family 2 protein [Amaricoccus solimangrovi]TPE48390.1 glycosyltransferase family 2 protein [Amaricoccus solimangrovi]
MSASPRPLVSIVTPVWNAAATLPRTLASVRAQGLADWEHLLIDDGSTDGSAALIAAAAAADPRVRPLATGWNGGAGVARNTGLRAARGRYIAFLDADDRWRPEKLARQIGFMERGGHAFAFTAYAREDASGRPLGIVAAPSRVTRAALLRRNVIGCLTAVYDAEALGRVEMPAIRRRQDYALWLRLLERVEAAHGLPEVLADYRVAAASLSGNKLVAARDTWALYRGELGLSAPRAAWYFGQYAVHGVLGRTGARGGTRPRRS